MVGQRGFGVNVCVLFGHTHTIILVGCREQRYWLAKKVLSSTDGPTVEELEYQHIWTKKHGIWTCNMVFDRWILEIGFDGYMCLCVCVCMMLHFQQFLLSKTFSAKVNSVAGDLYCSLVKDHQDHISYRCFEGSVVVKRWVTLLFKHGGYIPHLMVVYM